MPILKREDDDDQQADGDSALEDGSATLLSPSDDLLRFAGAAAPRVTASLSQRPVSERQLLEPVELRPS
jgi:hypothetical protein